MIQKRVYLKTEGQYKQLIGMARRDLNLDDDSHRKNCLAFSNGRTNTTTKMTRLELNNYFEQLKKLGFKPKPAKRKTTNSPKGDGSCRAKLTSIWLNMRDCGFISDASDSALTKFATSAISQKWAKKMGSQPIPQKLDWWPTWTITAAIEALKQWHLREISAVYSDAHNKVERLAKSGFSKKESTTLYQDLKKITGSGYESKRARYNHLDDIIKLESSK